MQHINIRFLLAERCQVDIVTETEITNQASIAEIMAVGHTGIERKESQAIGRERCNA